MSRSVAIAKLLPVFRQYGYEGASLALLSKATGLRKASLYHHFPGGKAEMAQAVLEYTADFVKTRIFAPLQAEGEPVDRIRQMTAGVREFYQDGQEACMLAVFSTGEADNLFHAALQKSLKCWIENLSQVLMDAGVKPVIAQQQAQDAVMTIQGALVLVRILDDTEPFNQLMDRLPGILLGAVDSSIE